MGMFLFPVRFLSISPKLKVVSFLRFSPICPISIRFYGKNLRKSFNFFPQNYSHNMSIIPVLLSLMMGISLPIFQKKKIQVLGVVLEEKDFLANNI